MVSGQQVRKAFERLGWTFSRQKGSHMILTKAGNVASLSVPNHDPIARGTLRSLVRSSGHTMEEFLAALAM